MARLTQYKQGHENQVLDKRKVYMKLLVVLAILTVIAIVVILIYMFASTTKLTEQSLIEQSLTEQTPTQQTPIKQTPTEQTPTKQTPTQQTPIELIPMKQTPTKETILWEPENQQNEPIRNKLESFAFYLYRMIDAENDGGNFVFSPISIYSALSYIGEGASSRTLDQIKEALYTSDFSNVQHFINTTFRENENYNLSLAQQIFIDNSISIRKPFKNFLNDNGLPAVKRMDFRGDPESCRLEINEWVENGTLNQIKDFLSKGQITPDTRIYVANALALEASWYYSMSWSNKSTFSVSQYEQVQTEMVFLEDLSFNVHSYPPCQYSKSDTTTVVVLPLTGGALEYIVAMPNKIGDFSAIHTKTGLKELFDMIRNPSDILCDVDMPKFKLKYDYKSLTNNLQEMGIRDLFDERLADLSRLYEGEQSLHVKDTVQKATFELDEYGIKGSAATGFFIMDLSYTERASISINKPFLFLVRNRHSGALLFVGKITNPLKS